VGLVAAVPWLAAELVAVMLHKHAQSQMVRYVPAQCMSEYTDGVTWDVDTDATLHPQPCVCHRKGQSGGRNSVSTKTDPP